MIPWSKIRWRQWVLCPWAPATAPWHSSARSYSSSKWCCAALPSGPLLAPATPSSSRWAGCPPGSGTARFCTARPNLRRFSLLCCCPSALLFLAGSGRGTLRLSIECWRCRETLCPNPALRAYLSVATKRLWPPFRGVTVFSSFLLHLYFCHPTRSAFLGRLSHGSLTFFGLNSHKIRFRSELWFSGQSRFC